MNFTRLTAAIRGGELEAKATRAKMRKICRKATSFEDMDSDRYYELMNHLEMTKGMLAEDRAARRAHLETH